MGWKTKILSALRECGPLRSGDLVARLGFGLEATALDAQTRFMDGLKPLSGSFCDSQAQRVLGNLVRRGEVIWQRAANMDNWYRLPDQTFPSEAAIRKRSLRSLVDEILALMPARVVNHPGNRWKHHATEIEDEDAWVELCPFVLSLDAEGWELADGDPICNWAGHTFSEVYPLDVSAAIVARRMKKWFRDDLRQCRQIGKST